MRRAFALLIAGLLLAGCGSDSPYEVKTVASTSEPTEARIIGEEAQFDVILADAVLRWRITEWVQAKEAHDEQVRLAVARRAEQDRAARAAARRASPRVSPEPDVQAAGTGRCGGDLPPCWVMMRESRGNPNAVNPTGCSGRGCYGKWQCDPRSCNGRGSEAEQDAEARRLWDGGRGCSHWNACG